MYEVVNERNEYKDRNILEMLRLQTFHLCHLKSGTTYQSFISKSGMTLPWDKKNKKDPDYKPVLDYNESIKMQEKVQEMMKKRTGEKTKVPVTKLISPVKD